jgi:ribose/xylose/arabinose/galactoside ABC-type transport system permease subunit
MALLYAAAHVLMTRMTWGCDIYTVGGNPEAARLSGVPVRRVLVIAVIQNRMNLTGVESYTQKVVLGLVILGAVLLDIVKRRGRFLFRAAAG